MFFVRLFLFDKEWVYSWIVSYSRWFNRVWEKNGCDNSCTKQFFNEWIAPSPILVNNPVQICFLGSREDLHLKRKVFKLMFFQRFMFLCSFKGVQTLGMVAIHQLTLYILHMSSISSRLPFNYLFLVLSIKSYFHLNTFMFYLIFILLLIKCM